VRQGRYAIIGTGAVGGLYGARLARAGFDVHFLLRSDFEHVRRQTVPDEIPITQSAVPVRQANQVLLQLASAGAQAQRANAETAAWAARPCLERRWPGPIRLKTAAGSKG